MRYKCKMCGTVLEDDGVPPTCPACGFDRFSEQPYTARCPHCGVGRYVDDSHGFCTACGRRIAPGGKNPVVKPLPGRASSRGGGSVRRNTKARTVGLAVLGTLLAGVLLWLVFLLLRWVFCFACAHWILILVVTVLILFGRMKK